MNGIKEKELNVNVIAETVRSIPFICFWMELEHIVVAWIERSIHHIGKTSTQDLITWMIDVAIQRVKLTSIMVQGELKLNGKM
mgnify:CR=1 FL=1